MSESPRTSADKLRALVLAAALGLAAGACGTAERPPARPNAGNAAVRPSILLVTLDTTRADAIGPDATGIQTPAFNALAARGVRFRQAYATVPETLPSHVSMMTGLYPAGHAIHENGRSLSASSPVIAERLRAAGYRTAAFVSSFTLARRFGLARGFDTYDDDEPGGRAERASRETTDAALAYLEGTGDPAHGTNQADAGSHVPHSTNPAEGGSRGSSRSGGPQRQVDERPLFMWVHYFDPHSPYEPPEPFRRRFASQPYLGEVAAMDVQLGRLAAAFERQARAPVAFVVVADHGEGLGEHGEALHGNLVYQSTMHVPLVIAGPGLMPAVRDTPVSTRRVFHTILDWAGLESASSLRRAEPEPEVVLGEAMKPFLEYGWQPQVMTVDGPHKAILAGRLEIYDVVADPAEARDLAGNDRLRSRVPRALRDYPVPSPMAARVPDTLDAEAKRSLASLGYISATAVPEVRKGAPRPADMTRLFDVMERASGLFVAERYEEILPLLDRILAADPFNLDAALRLAIAHSALGHDRRALEMFKKAAEISPGSLDVRTYLALHYARGPQWTRAVPLLEQVVAEAPDRLPALEGLARLRERQGRFEDAVALRQRIYTLRRATSLELAQMGELAMGVGRTDVAIGAFESERSLAPERFEHDLELGLLYMDARRFADARAALDRVSPSHPEYAMALFKRAQVSVLLNEPDRAARIERARQHADATTRALIARERLFEGVQ